MLFTLERLKYIDFHMIEVHLFSGLSMIIVYLKVKEYITDHDGKYID